MRKLFLTSFKSIGEEWSQRLVVLNLSSTIATPEEAQYEMALKKVEVWFSEIFPGKELSGVIVHPTIGDGIQADFAVTASSKEGKKWGTAKWGNEPVLTYDGVMMTSLTWEDIANKLNGSSKSNDSLLFTNWHTAKEIPDYKEEGAVANYVLIDLYGYRKAEDFEIGFYNITQERWCLKYSNRYPDLEHMKWTELPLNRIKCK